MEGKMVILVIAVTFMVGIQCAEVRKAKCKVKWFPRCYQSEHYCPPECPHHCEIDCAACKPVCNCNKPGAVCEDPRFVGGDGVAFYFHGKKNQDFCLVSDPDLHINAHFIGKSKASMKRDFTWVQSIAILFGSHNLFIGAHKVAKWDGSSDHLSVIFDGRPVNLPLSEGSEWRAQVDPALTMTRTHDTNEVVAEVAGKFKITARVVPITAEESRVHGYEITDEDCFAHLDLRFKFYSLSEEVSGVLGQTYREGYKSRVKMGAAMPIMGGDREFATTNLFAADCAMARFEGGAAIGGNILADEYAGMRCASGIGGHGIVCKK
ncbi:hypothetical protein AMTRI_Chr11g93790 [Amborella trichopoda]